MRPETEDLIKRQASANVRQTDRHEEPELNPRELAEREARFLRALKVIAS